MVLLIQVELLLCLLGTIIYPPDTETTIDDHVFAVQQDKLWGLLRSDNTFLVPPRYTNMLMPRGKYWQCFDNQNHTTVLDSTGRMVLSLPYYLAWGFTTSANTSSPK